MLRIFAVLALILDSCALLLCLARCPRYKSADTKNTVIDSVFLKVLLTSSSKQGCAIPAETEGHAPGNKAVVEVEKHVFLGQFGHFLAPRDRVAKNGAKSDDIGGILEPTWRVKLIQNA